MVRSSRSLSSVLLFATFIVLISACSEPQESIESRCIRVRDRLVSLEIPLADPHRERHAHVMRRAMGEFSTHCARSMSAQQRDCVLEASSSKDAFTCIDGASRARASVARRAK